MNTAAPLLDQLLAEHQEALGRDYGPYRNHCQRVYALTVALARRHGGLSQAQDESLQIALAFHDIGIWVSATFDYLEPSAALARQWLSEQGREDASALVEAMILDHHRLRATESVAGSALPEWLRQADLVDVSLGMIRFGLPYADYRALKKSYPVAGFHGRLVNFVFKWWVRHPLRPMPMMRW